MLPTIAIAGLGIYTIIVAQRTQRSIEPLSRKIHDKMQGLWQEAHQSIQSKNWQKAEKALLTILKFDNKDSSAYNRLGIIYAKQKSFDDAIQCFEIAKSIKPAASNYHNLGLLYLETQKYDKAQIAFEEALEMDNQNSLRYVALAKVYSHTNKHQQAVGALENAVRLDKSVINYQMLSEGYLNIGETVKANRYLGISKRLKAKEGAVKARQKTAIPRKKNTAKREFNNKRSSVRRKKNISS